MPAWPNQNGVTLACIWSWPQRRHREEAASGALRARLDELARFEARLVLDPDTELRFHSGVPVTPRQPATAQ